MRPFLVRIRSLKFLSALANALFIVINEGLGVPISREAYGWITGAIISFIVTEGYVDSKAVNCKK